MSRPSLGQQALTGLILLSTSFLLGAFFTHWIVDHNTIWRAEILDSSIRSSLVYYAHILSAPSWYLTTLASLSGAALVAALLKLILGGASGMFGGASFLLLSSALSVYIANARAALMFLPLDKMPSSSTPLDMRLTEALQSLAASHMIIAVSLTGVLSLQGAEYYSNRPSTPVVLVRPQAAVPST